MSPLCFALSCAQDCGPNLENVRATTSLLVYPDELWDTKRTSHGIAWQFASVTDLTTAAAHNK